MASTAGVAESVSSFGYHYTPLGICTDRGQGLQVFGDMGNSFDCAISPVELRDLAACEDHLSCSVLGGWHQSDRVSGERLGQFDGHSLEADPSLLLDTADLMFGADIDEWESYEAGRSTPPSPIKENGAQNIGWA